MLKGTSSAQSAPVIFEIHVKNMTQALPHDLSDHAELWSTVNTALDKCTYNANQKFLQSWKYMIWVTLPIVLLLIGVVILYYDVISGWSVICVVYICFYRADATMKNMFDTFRKDKNISGKGKSGKDTLGIKNMSKG